MRKLASIILISLVVGVAIGATPPRITDPSIGNYVIAVAIDSAAIASSAIRLPAGTDEIALAYPSGMGRSNNGSVSSLSLQTARTSTDTFRAYLGAADSAAVPILLSYTGGVADISAYVKAWPFLKVVLNDTLDTSGGITLYLYIKE